MRISRISTEFQIARSTYYSSHSKQLVNDFNSFKVIKRELMARSRRKFGGGGSPNKKLPLKQSIPLGI